MQQLCTCACPGCRVAVTACSWSTDGRLIAGGLLDGTIQLWDVKGERVGSVACSVRLFAGSAHMWSAGQLC